MEGISQVVNGSTSGTDRTPIAIVVPGLTSDSSAAVNFTTPIDFLPLFCFVSLGTVSFVSSFCLLELLFYTFFTVYKTYCLQAGKGRMECCCAKPPWTWRDIFNCEY